MKKIQLIFVALVTIMAFTVVSGAGVLSVQASQTDPTSDELAQALGCSDITARQGWVWSYTSIGESDVVIMGYDDLQTAWVLIMLFPSHTQSEASLSVSNVKGPITLWYDAYGSYDPEGPSPFTVNVVGPDGVVVSSQTPEWPYHIDVPGDGRLYTIEWKASSGVSRDLYTFSIYHVGHLNNPPVARAGADQSIRPNTNALLDGSASVDDEPGVPLTYAWSVKESPTGSNPQLSDPAAVKPMFTADQVGLYVIQLVVTDVTGLSSSDTVNVWVNNSPVITMATFQQNGVGAPVFLLGSATDLENDPLTYQWSLTDKPPESTLQLGLLSTTSIGGFVPDALGTYTARLTVSDGKATAITQDVSIPIALAGAPITSQMSALKSAVSTLSESAVNPGKKTALLADLNAVQKQVNKGNYGTAAKLLENTVLARMDGCVKNGAPDRNDFIIQYDAQLQLYSQVQPLALYLAWLVEHPP